MSNKFLRSGFFARHRIKIVMGAVVGEMPASPPADSPFAGQNRGQTDVLY
jgi:hypothetical protein